MIETRNQEIIAEPRPRPISAEREVAESSVSPVLQRLHALVRKGYVAEIGATERPDIVVLRHVGKAPDLQLRSDGVVEGHDARRPWYKRHIEPPAPIAPGDAGEDLRLMHFLDAVPAASFWDKTRARRKKFIYFPLALIAVWGACLALTALLIDL